MVGIYIFITEQRTQRGDSIFKKIFLYIQHETNNLYVLYFIVKEF